MARTIWPRRSWSFPFFQYLLAREAEKDEPSVDEYNREHFFRLMNDDYMM